MFWILGAGEVVRRLIMIFARPLPASVAAQFDHAEWIGFTAWDLIMPLFLFLVGTSMPLSLSKRLSKGVPRGSIYLQTLRRVCVLWILGMAAQGNLLSFDPSSFHYYSNTLQAIAAGYLVSMILILNTGLVFQLASIAVLLVAYWLLLVLVPVPGYGAGSLTPAGNLAMYVDTIILGRFRDGTTYTWILSTLGFASTVMLGVMSGRILSLAKGAYRKILFLSAAGCACVALGLAWSLCLPIIKHIWTSSFALFSAGLCFLLLAFFYWLIDVRGFSKWAFPLRVAGMNSIAAYLLTGVTEATLAGNGMMGRGPVAGFLAALGVLLGLWLILYAMYRLKLFVRC